MGFFHHCEKLFLFKSGKEKKMKKGLSVVLSVLLLFSVCVCQVHAFDDEATLKASYDKVVSYYTTTEIMYLDEIIALGNAGVDVSTMPLSSAYCEYDVNADFTTMGAGFLGKMILATIFMGEDPNDVNGNDLVALLSAKVDENGVVEECINDADDLVWALFALTAVGYENVEKVADVLASYQVSVDTVEGRDNDKGGFNGAWGVSMDVVGLVIEALSNINKERYESTINLALEYLERKQGEDAGYDPNDIWGDTPANTDTQSCVVEGLLVYDRDGVVNGSYDTQTNEISDAMLAFQNEDGSFINGGWDAGTSVANPISTYTALRALATYFNGSFVVNAKALYDAKDEVITPEETPEVIAPEKGPDTGDHGGLYTSLLFLLVSGYVLRGYSKKYE